MSVGIWLICSFLVFFLQVGLGLGYATDSPELVGGPIANVPTDTHAVGTACFIAAAIYVACIAFCGCQLLLRRKQEQNQGFQQLN